MASQLVITLLHSLWQSALLYFLISLLKKTFKYQSPDQKKLGWLLMLALQLLLSILTFFVYRYHNDEFSIPISSHIQNIFSLHTNQWIYQHQDWLILVYFFMLLAKTVKTVFGWIHFKSWVNKGTSKADASIRVFAIQKAKELGIKTKINIQLSNKISSPITFGFFKPVILLPVALVMQLSPEETETLILHELNHILRKDYLINWFLIILEHLYFFNPFIYLACNEIKWERELSCDLTVIQFKYPEYLYAGCLYKAALYQQQTFQFSLPFISGKKSLLNRIRFFSSPQLHRYTKKNTAASLTSVMIIFSFFTYFTLMLTNPSNHQLNQPAVHTKRKSVNSPNFETANNIKTYLTANSIASVKKSIQKKHLKKEKKSINIQNDVHWQSQNSGIAGAVNVKQQLTPGVEKQIIVKEEDPLTGEITTSSYRLANINGKWNSELLWMIKEKPSQPEVQ